MSQRPIRILAHRNEMPRIRRELSRRRFLSMAALAGAAPVIAACGGSNGGGGGGQAVAEPLATGGALEDTLSMYSWGEYDAPQVLKSFSKELGPKLVEDTFGSNEEMISKLVAAKGTAGYDIVVPTGQYIPQMVEQGLISPLNLDLIPNIEHMDPNFLQQDWDPDNTYSICKAWGTTGFVYDTTVINRELATWSDFIDAAQNEASGQTSVLDDPGEVTGIYYWANGIDMNTTDTGEQDACEDFIVNELAPHIAAFDSYPGGQAIPQATHALMQSWNGDARLGIMESGEPERWKWVLGAPTTLLWMDNWAVAGDAPHPEAAHAFINYVLAPDNALLELDWNGYHTGAKDIEAKAEANGFAMLDMVFLTDEQVATMQTGEVNEALQRTVDIWNKAKAKAGA
jgi:spermidine/putrescine transport system substrate-binding protein